MTLHISMYIGGVQEDMGQVLVCQVRAGMGRYAHTDTVRYGQIWSDTGRYGQIRADMVRYAQIWADTGRYGYLDDLAYAG